jgi:hypothetical protein
MYVAPKSTEVKRAWGSYNIVRNTTSTTNGVANTNTLYAFGSTTASGHPAAYYAKSLTTGGYNTWYLPAKNELNTIYSNQSATPFATANWFDMTSQFWSSTETDGSAAWGQSLAAGGQFGNYKFISANVRTVRRSAV